MLKILHCFTFDWIPYLQPGVVKGDSKFGVRTSEAAELELRRRCQNLGIAMFSVDSLRQLAMKFLEKQELTSFHFQVVHTLRLRRFDFSSKQHAKAIQRKGKGKAK